MLFVLFQLGKDRYALEASHVVEVVPLLALKRFPQAPKGMAGMFVYRGRPVPALDLCELTTGHPARDRMSTRILIIRHREAGGPERLLGIIAERATETLRREPTDFVDAGVEFSTAPFLGPVLMDGQGVIQLIHAQQLLSEPARQLLFAQPLEVSDAPH